jgi:ABC-type uncharacterized transport system permease subunit
MNSTLVGILSIFSYIIASTLIFRELIRRSLEHKTSIRLAWLAALLHSSYIMLVFQQQNGFNFSFFNVAGLVAIFIVLIVLLASIDKPLEKLGIAIFPLAAIMLGLDIFFPDKTHHLTADNWQMNLHILSSILAFSLLNIAALQAILLAIQDQQLRSHHPKRLILALPPLQAMETLLFQMIGVGLFFLTASLLSGFIFIEDLFAQHLLHKTVLAIIAWIIFTALLLGRLRFGWRGKTAIQWTIVGFVLLLLAYFGSKLVLELILKRV